MGGELRRRYSDEGFPPSYLNREEIWTGLISQSRRDMDGAYISTEKRYGRGLYLNREEIWTGLISQPRRDMDGAYISIEKRYGRGLIWTTDRTLKLPRKPDAPNTRGVSEGRQTKR
jgi:hypothetical protein